MTLDRARLKELRGWTAAAIERLGIAVEADRAVLPVHDATGDLVGHVRYQPDPTKLNGLPKMLANAGTTRELFPPPELIHDGEAVEGVVFVDEGEPDTARMWSIGLVAVGVPGAQNWRDEWAARFARPGWRIVLLLPRCVVQRDFLRPGAVRSLVRACPAHGLS